ncbi:hypothetical protein GQR58_030377 [Nymphon striatum]|nr:hypothetical protein GQR58_030377 [Nymphon striatum]
MMPRASHPLLKAITESARMTYGVILSRIDRVFIVMFALWIALFGRLRCSDRQVAVRPREGLEHWLHHTPHPRRFARRLRASLRPQMEGHRSRCFRGNIFASPKRQHVSKRRHSQSLGRTFVRGRYRQGRQCSSQRSHHSETWTGAATSQRRRLLAATIELGQSETCAHHRQVLRCGNRCLDRAEWCGIVIL